MIRSGSRKPLGNGVSSRCAGKRESMLYSFPVRSLFRFAANNEYLSLISVLSGELAGFGSGSRHGFPVFFPVSRELRQRRVRTRLRPPPHSLGIFLGCCYFLQNGPFAGQNGRIVHGSAFSFDFKGRNIAPRPPFSLRTRSVVDFRDKHNREFEFTFLRHTPLRFSLLISKKHARAKRGRLGR